MQPCDQVRRKGQKIVVPYVYFSMLTGKGKQDRRRLLSNSDGSGDAGAAAEVDIDIMCNNSAPVEYTYADDSAGLTPLVEHAANSEGQEAGSELCEQEEV